MSRQPATVAFVGGGPGDPRLLTLAAAERLRTADVIVVDRACGAEFVRQAGARTDLLVDAGPAVAGQELTAASRAKLVLRTVQEHPEARIVRVMDGDPASFGGLAEEAAALARAGIPFEVVPGVSVVHAVSAYAGIPLATSNSPTVQVFHPASATCSNLAAAQDPDVTVVMFGEPSELADALTRLAMAGRADSTPVAVTERGATTDQHTVTGELREMAAVVRDLHYPAVAVVGPPVAWREHLNWFESKPLFGWRVLVPRTKDQAGPMADQLRDHGASSQVVPTIGVEPPRSPQQIERAIKGMVTGRYQWVGFTSVNAVKAVREHFDRWGLDARAFSGLKIAAVGGTTAAALRAWGLQPDLVPEGESSALGLLQVWPAFDALLDPINRVFLPRADIATDTLVAGLHELGWEVDAVTAYRTVRAAPPPAAIREGIKGGQFDAVVLTSSSTVRNLIGIAGKPPASTVVACIGPATAKTAQEYGLRVDVLAPEATGAALVDALADFGRAAQSAAHASGVPFARPSQRSRRPQRGPRSAKG